MRWLEIVQTMDCAKRKKSYVVKIVGEGGNLGITQLGYRNLLKRWLKSVLRRHRITLLA